MRTRNEIENVIDHLSSTQKSAPHLTLILEVLLDIRTLLTELRYPPYNVEVKVPPLDKYHQYP